MPRYFFHIINNDSSLVPDEEGGNFESFETANNEAVESLRDLVADAVKWRNKVNGLAIQIADEAGTILDTVEARDTLWGLCERVI
jgi:uncharacterized protein DUF6894